MPINQQQRLDMADKLLRRHYPTIGEDVRKEICQVIAEQFSGNYSPVKREQESMHATGKGASFKEFSIVIARQRAKINPVDFSEEELGAAITKVWTY